MALIFSSAVSNLYTYHQHFRVLRERAEIHKPSTGLDLQHYAGQKKSQFSSDARNGEINLTFLMRGTTKSHFKMNQIPEGVENVATFRTHQSQASIALRLDHIKGSACQQALASATLDTRTLQPS